MPFRLGNPSTPDVDLMLSIVAGERCGAPSNSATAATAAQQLLTDYGVESQLVDVRLVLMNAAAVQQLTAAANDPLQVRAVTELPPYMLTLGLAGKDRHRALRCGDWLLDLSLGGCLDTAHGLRPGPLRARLDQRFWSGEEVAYLAGDDGSAIWAWLLPDEPDRRWRTDDPVDAEQAVRLLELWSTAVDGAHHPGWVRTPHAA